MGGAGDAVCGRTARVGPARRRRAAGGAALVGVASLGRSASDGPELTGADGAVPGRVRRRGSKAEVASARWGPLVRDGLAWNWTRLR